MNKALIVLLLVVGVPAVAQTAPSDPAAGLASWAATQQAQVGVSLDLHKTKYAVTWWDAVSWGQKGVNVGLAGAKDYIDLGPAMAVANGASPRWGQAIPLHVGNIWNSATSSLPPSTAAHFNLVTLPNVTVSPLFLVPDHKPITKWTWSNDFQVVVAYRIGGSSN